MDTGATDDAAALGFDDGDEGTRYSTGKGRAIASAGGWVPVGVDGAADVAAAVLDDGCLECAELVVAVVFVVVAEEWVMGCRGGDGAGLGGGGGEEECVRE